MNVNHGTDRYPLGRLVLCPDSGPLRSSTIGIITRASPGPGCQHYYVKTPTGDLMGPYRNYELVDAETNMGIIPDPQD